MNYLKHQPKNRLQKFFANWNEHLTVPAIIALALLVIVVSLLTSCQKEQSFSKGEPQIESDHHLKPAGGYNLTKRDVTPELQMASKKANPGKGKGKPQPPADTTNPEDPQPPTGSYKNVLYLDFDGEYVEGTYWNVNGPLTLRYSGMTGVEIDTTVERTRREYEPLGFTVTTDRALFFLSAASYRQQLIVTESWEWYGQAGGVAYVGSYKWSVPQPCFVFSSLLGYGGKIVADAGIHEFGHTLGLRHVPQPDGSSAYATYGNYMGAAYYVPRGFFESAVRDQYGAIVDQFAVIKSNL